MQTTLTPVQSSTIKAVGYDAEAGALLIEFHRGTTYRYDKVPADVHAALVAAESPGRYFTDNIRGKFGHRPVAQEQWDGRQ